MEHTKTKGCLDSLTLKLLAMALMLCDHLWATVLPGVMWLTAVGRIAFPIFAFQVAEGFQMCIRDSLTSYKYIRSNARISMWAG